MVDPPPTHYGTVQRKFSFGAEGEAFGHHAAPTPPTPTQVWPCPQVAQPGGTGLPHRAAALRDLLQPQCPPWGLQLANTVSPASQTPPPRHRESPRQPPGGTPTQPGAPPPPRSAPTPSCATGSPSSPRWPPDPWQSLSQSLPMAQWPICSGQ